MKNISVKRLLNKIASIAMAAILTAGMMPTYALADEIDDTVAETAVEENSKEDITKEESALDDEAVETPLDADAAEEEQLEELLTVSDEEAIIKVCMAAPAKNKLSDIVDETPIYAVCYLSDWINIMSEASEEAMVALSVESGQTVEIMDITFDDEHTEWAFVKTNYGESEYAGFIKRQYLAVSDERFLGWESEYKTAQVALNDEGIPLLTAAANQDYSDIDQFPDSYREALRTLKDAHPNWIFVKQNLGVDFNASVQREIGEKSYVYKTFPDYTKNGATGQANWFYASEGIIRYYMDPRNGLTEDRIFQFEQLTYNESYHTQAALEEYINQTFMKCDVPAPGMEISYGSIIWNIGAALNVSPFHMATRIVQEQGVNGTSPLISGTYPGYEGYYNYFNVKASGKTTEEVIINGLTHAKNSGWASPYDSIYGGASLLSNAYISNGQDTGYLQKFHVVSNKYGIYTHQYMQNISAPTTEASNTKKMYAKSNALNNAFVFKIPVYENMSASAAPYPTSSTSITLYAPAGYTGTALSSIWVDGVEYKTTAINGGYMVDIGNTSAKSAVMYNYNESGVPVGMYVWTVKHNGSAYEITAEPELENLLTYHGFSIRIVGKSGIRVKTGIDRDLRAKLTSTGVDGYKLTEYGTLVMNNANRASYPMIAGGEKVKKGVSFGKNENGEDVNLCYEITNGRIRYTSVLVGLPVSQYKIEYAFRGYAVLNKDGQDTVIYGPAVAKSIYSLANQVLANNTYAEGSESHSFLKSIINDADNNQ